MIQRILNMSLFVALAAPAACGGSSAGSTSGVPYHPGDVTVLGDSKNETLPAPTGCDSSDCTSALHSDCATQDAADVVVDASGKVLDVICYKPDVQVTAVTGSTSVGDVSVGNNGLVVVDGAADGGDVAGNVTLTGNNDAIYGHGPAVSAIGAVDVQKNNARIRGVRIRGDVTIDKNDTKLIFCVIEGNLTITGNNTTIANCDVLGTTTVTGQNTILVGDRFGGPREFSGGNMVCSADFEFTDANGNEMVDASELGPAVTCGDKNK
jgi:hypothetical protein